MRALGIAAVETVVKVSGAHDAHARAPGIGGLDAGRPASVTAIAGRVEPRLTAVEGGRVGRLEREPGKPGAILASRSGAGAVPDIAGDVVMVAPGRHERWRRARRRVTSSPTRRDRTSRRGRRRRRADGRGRCAARPARRRSRRRRRPRAGCPRCRARSVVIFSGRVPAATSPVGGRDRPRCRCLPGRRDRSPRSPCDRRRR